MPPPKSRRTGTSTAQAATITDAESRRGRPRSIADRVCYCVNFRAAKMVHTNPASASGIATNRKIARSATDIPTANRASAELQNTTARITRTCSFIAAN